MKVKRITLKVIVDDHYSPTPLSAKLPHIETLESDKVSEQTGKSVWDPECSPNTGVTRSETGKFVRDPNVVRTSFSRERQKQCAELQNEESRKTRDKLE